MSETTNFEKYVETTNRFLIELEHFNKRKTKAGARRLRGLMQDISNLKVEAKRETDNLV